MITTLIKLTIHETKICYGDKVRTVKSNTVFLCTELELFIPGQRVINLSYRVGQKI